MLLFVIGMSAMVCNRNGCFCFFNRNRCYILFVIGLGDL